MVRPRFTETDLLTLEEAHSTLSWWRAVGLTTSRYPQETEVTIGGHTLRVREQSHRDATVPFVTRRRVA